MCPLRFIVVFFSVILAAFIAWKSVISDDTTVNYSTLQPADAAAADDDDGSTQQKTPTTFDHHEKHQFEQHFLKMIHNGFWVFVDMASGRYLWRNFKQLNTTYPSFS